MTSRRLQPRALILHRAECKKMRKSARTHVHRRRRQCKITECNKRSIAHSEVIRKWPEYGVVTAIKSSCAICNWSFGCGFFFWVWIFYVCFSVDSRFAVVRVRLVVVGGYVEKIVWKYCSDICKRLWKAVKNYLYEKNWV